MDSSKKTAQETFTKQPVVQMPVKLLDHYPSGVEIANWNDGTIAIDKTDGILFVRGKNKTFKFTGTAI